MSHINLNPQERRLVETIRDHYGCDSMKHTIRTLLYNARPRNPDTPTGRTWQQAWNECFPNQPNQPELPPLPDPWQPKSP